MDQVLRAVDEYVAATTPTLTVPKANALPKLTSVGHRYLVARDGLYIEYRRPWCWGVHQISKSTVELPFGDLTPVHKVSCGRPPQALIDNFRRIAVEALPNEVACWIVWDESAVGDDAWRLLPLRPITSDANHVTFDREVLKPGEHLVLDIHSHGTDSAFFSPADDKDDRIGGEIKISMVIGNLDREQFSTVRRLCVLGSLGKEEAL